jgi:cofilin
LNSGPDSGAEAEAGNEVTTEKKIGAKKHLRQGNDEALEANSSGKKNKKVPVSKHPLRAAGMKPGEACFLCKLKDHIAKNCPQKNENRNKVSLYQEFACKCCKILLWIWKQRCCKTLPS